MTRGMDRLKLVVPDPELMALLDREHIDGRLFTLERSGTGGHGIPGLHRRGIKLMNIGCAPGLQNNVLGPSGMIVMTMGQNEGMNIQGVHPFGQPMQEIIEIVSGPGIHNHLPTNEIDVAVISESRKQFHREFVHSDLPSDVIPQGCIAGERRSRRRRS